MTGQRWKDVEELFHRVLENEPETRSGFLDAACGDDIALRDEVTKLLLAFDTSETERLRADPDSGEGRDIGQYKAIRKIGEGGMGSVFLAERQDEQFVKKVAIKLIRSGPGSHALIQRFYTERQILAGMEHPNIARLTDGGVTDDGQPYLVMDYIDGQRLDGYCDGKQLSIRERLELFRKVCSAVTYAHQALVVHRDLKPNNILVSSDGEPKLLDFGLAKVLQESPAGTADATVTAGLFFTPFYACPETLRGSRPTVSADVYALGIILYELLSGHRPFENLANEPAAQMHAVMTKDPPHPSDTVMAAEASGPSAVDAAARRGETPEKLKRLLRGDLDGIVQRAVARLPEERYASVAELSDDIASYLDGRPVRALPQTIRYTAAKFLRRNRIWLTAAAAVLVFLAAAGGYAAREQWKASQRFEETRAIAKYLLFDLFDELSRLPGSTGIRAKMAQQAQAQLDQLSLLARSNAPVRLEAAAGYNRLAEVYGVPGRSNLGDSAAAAQNLKRAQNILDDLCASGAAGGDACIEKVRNSLLQAKLSLWGNGKTEGGAVLIAGAERELEHVKSEQNPKWLRMRSMLRTYQVELADLQERWADEARLAGSGLAEMSEWPAAMPPDEESTVQKIWFLRLLGNSLFYSGKPTEALERYREAKAVARDADARWPNRPAVLNALMGADYDIGTTLDALKSPPLETYESFRQAIEVGQRLVAIDDRDDNVRRIYLMLRQASAETLAQAGRFDEAFREQEFVVRSRSASAAAQPGVNLAARDLAFSIFVLGDLHWANQNRAEACQLWKSAIERFEALRKGGGLSEWDWDHNVAKVRDHLKFCAAR